MHISQEFRSKIPIGCTATRGQHWHPDHKSSQSALLIDHRFQVSQFLFCLHVVQDAPHCQYFWPTLLHSPAHLADTCVDPKSPPTFCNFEFNKRGPTVFARRVVACIACVGTRYHTQHWLSGCEHEQFYVALLVTWTHPCPFLVLPACCIHHANVSVPHVRHFTHFTVSRVLFYMLQYVHQPAFMHAALCAYMCFGRS